MVDFLEEQKSTAYFIQKIGCNVAAANTVLKEMRLLKTKFSASLNSWCQRIHQLSENNL